MPKPFRINRPQARTTLTARKGGAEGPKLFRMDGDKSLTVYVYDIIDDWWGFSVADFALELDRAGDLDRINVRINSPGGDAYAGLAMYNLLAGHSASVHVKVDGLAASAASVIAMAGDKITMGLASEMMIHYPWVLAIGNSADLRKVADDLAVMDEGFVDFYAQRTGLPKDEVREMLAAETFLSAKECVDKGFADEMAGDDDETSAQASCQVKAAAKVAFDAYNARRALDQQPDDDSDAARRARWTASKKLTHARRKLREAINQAR